MLYYSYYHGCSFQLTASAMDIGKENIKARYHVEQKHAKAKVSCVRLASTNQLASSHEFVRLILAWFWCYSSKRSSTATSFAWLLTYARSTLCQQNRYFRSRSEHVDGYCNLKLKHETHIYCNFENFFTYATCFGQGLTLNFVESAEVRREFLRLQIPVVLLGG